MCCIVFLLGLTGFAATILAQTPGTFTATGNLPTTFPWSATLLPDGKVLVLADGNSDTGKVAADEIYDPRTGTFMATGDRSPNGGYMATLLPNGKVLIAETWGTGANGHVSLGHAELYDPDTGKFAVTGDMTEARAGGTATLLNNGKVLIAGGWVTPEGHVFQSASASAELYDPSTGTFAATGSMHEPLADTATLLPNGKVLITRSYVYDYGAQRLNLVRHAELYDPSTGTFAFTGDVTTEHAGRPTATLLTNGMVLLAGGTVGDCDGDCAPTALAELYDPTTGIFTATGNMNEARSGHTASLLPDGRVLITGGSDVGGASAETYDPATGTFSAASNMTMPRYQHLATLLNSGKVLVAGGYNLSSAEVYTPAVLVAAPVLLSLSGDGQGQGAIQHAGTIRIASAADPAVAGEALTIYAHGLPDGSVIPPQVAIGGQMAETISFGMTPGYPGLNYINVRAPEGVAPGPAVSVRLTYIGRTSNGVTIGVR
jgi:hypothetical protein